MGLFRYLSDNTASHSLANRLRRQRFSFFESLLERVPRPVKILDVGGSAGFWRQMGYHRKSDLRVVVLNNDVAEIKHTDSPTNETTSGQSNISFVLGDARCMTAVASGEFDVVFSNSVIEHLGSIGEQVQMMEEVRRVGARYFVQTPNYWFPVEPHFHFVGFQFLPVPVRVALLQTFPLGWSGRVRDAEQAEAIVSSINLLCRSDLKTMCPEAKIYSERLFGITKSLIVYAGWD